MKNLNVNNPNANQKGILVDKKMKFDLFTGSLFNQISKMELITKWTFYPPAAKIEPIKWNSHPTITKKLLLLYFVFKKNKITFDLFDDVMSRYLSIIQSKKQNNDQMEVREPINLWACVFWEFDDIKKRQDYNPYEHPHPDIFAKKPNKKGLRNKRLYRFIGKPVHDNQQKNMKQRKKW